ncbi:hypothetical protein ACI2KR_31005 [Pseudomonas luteola]
MTTRMLPEGAYLALEGLKAQAKACMLPKDEQKPALAAAQLKMMQNDIWTKTIVKELLKGKNGHTINTIDDQWLEDVFA